jgi:hypothetical protein
MDLNSSPPLWNLSGASRCALSVWLVARPTRTLLCHGSGVRVDHKLDSESGGRRGGGGQHDYGGDGEEGGGGAERVQAAAGTVVVSGGGLVSVVATVPPLLT